MYNVISLTKGIKLYFNSKINFASYSNLDKKNESLLWSYKHVLHSEQMYLLLNNICYFYLSYIKF